VCCLRARRIAREHHPDGIKTCRRQDRAGIAAMSARDLAHQAEAKPGARGSAIAGGSVKGGKDALAILGGDPRTVVADQDYRRAVGLAYLDADRGVAVPLRIIDQIAQQPLQ
jgi:hypothetical protein